MNFFKKVRLTLAKEKNQTPLFIRVETCMKLADIWDKWDIRFNLESSFNDLMLKWHETSYATNHHSLSLVNNLR